MRIRDAPAYSNALHGEELLLRDAGVSDCHDLADLHDRYDMLDLTNNDLSSLTGDFPELRRLSGLLLTHNKISLADEDFGKRLPRLELLSLAHNDLHDINQLNFIKHLPRLQHLSLEGNPITEMPDYRVRILAIHPRIHYLDFERVREADRQRARENFGAPRVSAKHESPEIKARREALLSRLENATDLAEIDAIDKELAAYI